MIKFGLRLGSEVSFASWSQLFAFAPAHGEPFGPLSVAANSEACAPKWILFGNGASKITHAILWWDAPLCKFGDFA